MSNFPASSVWTKRKLHFRAQGFRGKVRVEGLVIHHDLAFARTQNHPRYRSLATTCCHELDKLSHSYSALVEILKDSNYRARESAWGDCPECGWVDPTYTFNRFAKRSRHRFLGSIP